MITSRISRSSKDQKKKRRLKEKLMSSRSKTQQLSLLSLKNRKRKRMNPSSNLRLEVKEIFKHGKINLETRKNHRRNGEMNAQKEMSVEVEAIEVIAVATEEIKTNSLVGQ